MTLAERIVVATYSGVTRLETRSSSALPSGNLPRSRGATKDGNERFAGWSHLVVMKSKRTNACRVSSARANRLLRNVSGPNMRQFTVHSNLNCRDSSNALPTYPFQLVDRNGIAMATCICAMRKANRRLPPSPLPKKSTTATAGSDSSSDILIPRPQLYAMLPSVHCRFWKNQMASQKKKAAKQSLKHRRTNTLCRRFERINSGKM